MRKRKMLSFPLKSEDRRASTSALVAAPLLSPSISSIEEFNLSTDVLIEIFKRLPLKSLLRLSCVCKSWFSLLVSPTFLCTHATYNFTNSNTTHNLHVFKESIHVHTESFRTKFSVYNTDTLLKQVGIECPVGKKHFIVSSRDGLVCLFDFYSRNPKTAPLILWNSSIRKALVVPVPVDGFLDFTSGGFPKLIFGFGFDSSANDYKVVRIAYFNGGGGDLESTLFRPDVYGLSVGEWRRLSVASVSHKFSTIRWRGEFLNGVVHWISNVDVISNDNRCIQRSILTFKLESEEFGEIELPKELVNATNQTVRIATVPKGCKEVLGVIHNVFCVFSLWVMELYGSKESWVKLFSVSFGSMVRNDMNVAVLSDEVVVVQTLSSGWIFYDHKNKEIKNLMTMPGELDYVDTYVESLLLFGQRNGILPGKELLQLGPNTRGSGRGRRGNSRAM